MDLSKLTCNAYFDMVLAKSVVPGPPTYQDYRGGQMPPPRARFGFSNGWYNNVVAAPLAGGKDRCTGRPTTSRKPWRCGTTGACCAGWRSPTPHRSGFAGPNIFAAHRRDCDAGARGGVRAGVSGAHRRTPGTARRRRMFRSYLDGRALNTSEPGVLRGWCFSLWRSVSEGQA